MITQSAHLPAALACSEISVAALVDPVLERIGGVARRFGISPLLARNVGEVFDRIDAAVIATPNNTHAPIALECIAAGVPVLIEKPLAANRAEGRSIADAARERGVLVAPGYVTRFRRNLQLLKSLLERNHFGRVRRFVHQFGTPGGWAPFSAYNLARAATGGGVLMVTGTHFLDRMLWFWGMPARVSYWDDSHGGPEANCVAQFFFEGADGNFEGEVRYSKTTALPGGLVIEAEQGVVTLADTEDAELLFRAHDQPGVVQALREAASEAQGETFTLQMRAFAGACQGRETYPIPVEQAVQSLELIEQLYSQRQPLVDDWYGVVS